MRLFQKFKSRGFALLALLGLLLVSIGIVCKTPASRADGEVLGPTSFPELIMWKRVYEWVDSDDSDTINAGDILRYEIVLWNLNWFVPATNVTLRDQIPAGTAALGDAVLLGIPGDGEIISQDPLEIRGMTVLGGCLWGRLITFSVRITCPIDCGTMISNQAFAEYIRGEEPVVVPSDDMDTPEPNDPTLYGPVVSRANLIVEKETNEPGDVAPGQRIDYTVTITNTGCMNASGVTFEDVIPGNTTPLGNATATSGTVVSQNPVRVTGMSVPVGSPQTVTFSVRVNSPLDCGTEIKNRGAATYDPDGPCPLEPETVESNLVKNKVVSRANISAWKGAAPVGDVAPGARIDYTVTITNTGKMNASGVTFEDVIPGNTTPLGNATATSGTVVSQNPVRVTGMSVPVGSPQTVTFSVRVNSPLDWGTQVENKGTVIYDPDGPCPLEPVTADTNTVKNRVVSAASLALLKQVSPAGDVTREEQLDYTVTISNTGNMNASGVTFEDTIPSNTVAVGNTSATSGTVVSQDPVRVTGMSIAAGGSATVTFSVKVDADAPSGAVITNVGKVTYDPDGNGPNGSTVKTSNRVDNTVIVRRPPLPPKVSTKWYLSEGYTGKDLYYPGESFDTYILIQNATTTKAIVEATFMREGFEPVVQEYEIAPRSRFTVHLNEVPGCANHHISTMLVSKNGVDIAAERAMYFRYTGLEGGHDSIGVPEPSRTWYIPEGYTGDNNYPGERFDTFILLANPGEEKANVDVTFFREGNTPVNMRVEVGSLARKTIIVDEVPGCENAHISTRVVSDKPIIAERALYYRYAGLEGGHNSIGATAPATEWYMAEGYTGDNNYPGESFNTYILLENPNKQQAKVKATYMRQGDTPVEVDYTLAPETRFTIHLDAVPGCENASIATRVASDKPIVAERVSYFNYDGKDGGHGSIAAGAGMRWFLPEGYTGDENYPGESFDSYILLMNPNKKEIEVSVSFMAPPYGKQEKVLTKTYKLGPLSRFTIHVDEVEGFENTSFSTEVKSLTRGAPVIAERAMYFNYSGLEGGHSSIGYDP